MRAAEKHIKVIAVAVLLLSACTFFVPRETFDPHIGFDDDIFCRLYNVSAGQLIFSAQIMLCEDCNVQIHLPEKIFRQFALAEHVNRNKSPPLLRSPE